MKYTRHYVESKGRLYAGNYGEHGEWTEVNALGVPMYARTDDFSVTPCLINDGFWESWITAWFLNNLGSDTFVDIGANTGYYSILAANKGLTVEAYEPNPKYVEMMNASQTLVEDGDFRVYECAVSNRSGTAILSIPERLQGSATIRDVDLSAYNSSPLEVRTVTLDTHFANAHKRDMLIKVDAEGAEELVWDGAQHTNERHSPVWMIEYTPGAYSDEFLDKLESYGDLMWINHSGEEEPIDKGYILSRTDWLMLVIRPRT